MIRNDPHIAQTFPKNSIYTYSSNVSNPNQPVREIIRINNCPC